MTNPRDLHPKSSNPHSSLKREPLSPDTVAQLRDHAERTGVGAMRLLRGAKDKPAGLNSGTVSQWIRGGTKSAVPSHVAYVMTRWAALPTNKRLAFTLEMRAQLNVEFVRTGMGAVQILKRAKDIPPGLTHQIIQSWTSDGTKPNTASETHWHYVMARLAAMPDCVPASARLVGAGNKLKIEIAPDDLAELRHHRERTGIGGGILLRNASDKPAGLTPTMISNWLSGTVNKAVPELVAYVLARYRAWP